MAAVPQPEAARQHQTLGTTALPRPIPIGRKETATIPAEALTLLPPTATTVVMQ